MNIKIKNLLTQIEIQSNNVKVPVVEYDTGEFLISSIKDNYRILEIGTGIGYSGILMLANTKGTHLTTIEKRELRAELAFDNFKQADLLDRVDIITADALEYLENLSSNIAESQKFDFIFLDGAMALYPDFIKYFKKVLRHGGTLVTDNILELNRANIKTIKKILPKINEYTNLIMADKDFESQIYYVGEGLCVSGYCHPNPK